MVKIGELREKVDLLSKAQVPDGQDSITETRVVIDSFWAKVQQVSDATYYGTLTVQTDEPVTHRFTIRNTGADGISTETYLRWRGRDFRVRRVRELDMMERFIEISAGEETPVRP